MSLVEAECDGSPSPPCLHSAPVKMPLAPRFLAMAFRKAPHGAFFTLVPWSSWPVAGAGRADIRVLTVGGRHGQRAGGAGGGCVEAGETGVVVG